MKTRKYVWLAIALLTALCANNALADDAAPLRIGIMALKPYGYYDDNQKPKGSLFEIGKAILHESKLNGYVSIQPIKRMFRALQESNTIDCTITAMSPPFRKIFQLIESIGWNLDFGVIPRKGLTLTEYDHMDSIRIAVARGIHMNEKFDGDTSLNKIVVTNYESAMFMLDRGRADAAAGVVSSLLFSARKSGIDPAGFGKPLLLRHAEVWFYCAPDSPVLKHEALLRKTVKRLKETGFVEEVIGRY